MAFKSKTGKPFKKITQAESELRLQQVYEMLIDSYSRYMIIQYCTKTWGLEARQVDEYIKKATDKIKEYVNETVEDFTNKSKAKFEKLYNMAIKNRDFTEARQIIKTESEVLGYAKLNVEIAGKGGGPIEIKIDKEFDGV
jgi:hypothetical protein